MVVEAEVPVIGVPNGAFEKPPPDAEFPRIVGPPIPPVDPVLPDKV